MEMIVEREQPTYDINAIDNLPKINERSRIIANFAAQQSPERFVDNKELKGLQIDSKNKIQSIFKT